MARCEVAQREVAGKKALLQGNRCRRRGWLLASYSSFGVRVVLCFWESCKKKEENEEEGEEDRRPR